MKARKSRPSERRKPSKPSKKTALKRPAKRLASKSKNIRKKPDTRKSGRAISATAETVKAAVPKKSEPALKRTTTRVPRFRRKRISSLESAVELPKANRRLRASAKPEAGVRRTHYRHI